MKKVFKTKYGTLTTIKDKKHEGKFEILDSVGRMLFNGCTKSFIKEQIRKLSKAKKIDNWLECFDDVCWGSKEEIKDFIKHYHDVTEDREFDEEWFEHNYNVIGDTYIFFEYSDCFKWRP